MICSVLFLAAEHHKIFGIVVSFVPVNMVNHLPWSQWAPKLLFSYYSVLMSTVFFCVSFPFPSVQV